MKLAIRKKNENFMNMWKLVKHTLEQPVSQRINQKNIKNIQRQKMKIYQTICDIAKQYLKGKFHCKKNLH